MEPAKIGDSVKVHYTGKFEDGIVFDTSRDKEPFEFIIGENMVIPGFEKGIIGMNVGEKKTINVPFSEGYGPVREEAIIEVPRKDFSSDALKVGSYLQVSNDMGESFVVKVLELNDEYVKLDANHPLAGKNLIFEVELLEIKR